MLNLPRPLSTLSEYLLPEPLKSLSGFVRSISTLPIPHSMSISPLTVPSKLNSPAPNSASRPPVMLSEISIEPVPPSIFKILSDSIFLMSSSPAPQSISIVLIL